MKNQALFALGPMWHTLHKSVSNKLLHKELVVFRISFLLNTWDENRRSSHRMCSVKNVFLEISQNSQKNTCARDSFLIKSLAQVFPVNITKLLRIPFFTEHLRTTSSGISASQRSFNVKLSYSAVFLVQPKSGKTQNGQVK